MPKTVPLSSLDMVPMTADTRQRLADAGMDLRRIAGLSEMGGQSLLVLNQHVNDDEGAHAPSCYQNGYEPASAMCRGCVYAPRCWRSDANYLDRLRAGLAGEPPGVPSHVVAARLAPSAEPIIPPPPALQADRRKVAPPSPPARKRKAVPPPPPPRRK